MHCDSFVTVLSLLSTFPVRFIVVGLLCVRACEHLALMHRHIYILKLGGPSLSQRCPCCFPFLPSPFISILFFPLALFSCPNLPVTLFFRQPSNGVWRIRMLDIAILCLSNYIEFVWDPSLFIKLYIHLYLPYCTNALCCVQMCWHGSLKTPDHIPVGVHIPVTPLQIRLCIVSRC